MLRETKEDLLRIFFLTAIGCGVGAVMILVPADVLTWLSYVVLGIAVILFALPEFIHQIVFFGDEPLYEFILTCFTLAFGFALMFWHLSIVMIVIGALLYVIPLIKIFTCNAKMAMFRTQLPALILGIILLIVGPGKLLHLLFPIGGWVLIALSIVYCIYSLCFLLPKKRIRAIEREMTEVPEDDGNGPTSQA